MGQYQAVDLQAVCGDNQAMSIVSLHLDISTDSLWISIMGFSFQTRWGAPEKSTIGNHVHMGCPFGYVTATTKGVSVFRSEGCAPPTYRKVFARGIDPWNGIHG